MSLILIKKLLNYDQNINKDIEWHLTVRLVDGNEVIEMKCCSGNSNEGMNMRIGNEVFLFGVND